MMHELHAPAAAGLHACGSQVTDLARKHASPPCHTCGRMVSQAHLHGPQKCRAVAIMQLCRACAECRAWRTLEGSVKDFFTKYKALVGHYLRGSDVGVLNLDETGLQQEGFEPKGVLAKGTRGSAKRSSGWCDVPCRCHYAELQRIR